MMDPSDQKPWHRQFWPWFLIALPAVVVIACFYTVYLALDNPLSIVKEDYYKEGLAINQNQQRYTKSRELGISARCGRVDQHMECEFISGSEAIGTWPLQLQLMHPVNSDKDMDLSLHPLVFPRYQSDELGNEEVENLRREPRWYIYLEAVGGEWALQTEASLQENAPFYFHSDSRAQ